MKLVKRIIRTIYIKKSPETHGPSVSGSRSVPVGIPVEFGLLDKGSLWDEA